MANRRQVVGAGLALAVLPGIGRSLTWRQLPRTAPIPVGRLVIDARFADAVEMAAQVTTAGIGTRELERDVLGLWMDDLLPALTSRRIAAIGGVTAETPLFLIRTLAADHRMRVIYRADHFCPASGVIRHVIAGSARTVSGIAGTSGSGDWRLRFGSVLGACHAAGRPVKRTLLTASNPADARAEKLVSWVIAPIAASAPYRRKTRADVTSFT